jgi:hypothetical protein
MPTLFAHEVIKNNGNPEAHFFPSSLTLSLVTVGLLGILFEEGRRQEAQRAEGTSHKGIRPLLKNVPRSLWLWRVPLYTLAP